MICKYCNTENKEEARFCIDCGEKMNDANAKIGLQGQTEDAVPNYAASAFIMKNGIAEAIKVYAFINGGASIILGLIVASSIYEMQFAIFFMVAGTGIIASLFIYALGEIIDLLQNIKNNTILSNSPESLANNYNSKLPPL